MQNEIKIIGAKENNLKNISLSIPKNKLVVLTGVSGSGKSTIAFETLQTECQRQYMESLGMVTDEFVKPNVGEITGLSPAISVSQSNANRNPRSTVGTITEIYTYLRILYAKLGVRKCKHCCKEILPQFEDEILSSDILDDDTFASDMEEGMPCPHCGKTIPILTMSHFSFNKPQGACEVCNGIGVTNVPNLEKIINENLSINEGAVLLWDDFLTQRNGESVENAGKHYGFEADLNKPLNSWNDTAKTFLFHGALSNEIAALFPDVKPPKTVPLGRYEGLLTNLKRRYSENATAKNHEKIKQLFHEDVCPTCNGTKLKKDSAKVTVNNLNIIEIGQKSLSDLLSIMLYIEKNLSKEAIGIVAPITQSIKQRLHRFLDVGVGYLSLQRSAVSLSGGEAQRLRLASLLGSGLTGVLYVLDEPTTGLHSRDTEKLLNVLCHLRDLGNTVLVIEHDLEFMQNADYIIDIGPGAGEFGGQVVAAGTVEEIINNKNSITGKYLSGELTSYRSKDKRKNTNHFLSVQNATANNLKNVTVDIPLSKLIAVSGVSGSGKSSLVFDVIAAHADCFWGKNKAPNNAIVTNFEHLNRFITFDQAAIGRSTRSNVATYTDIYTDIREFFASMPSAKIQKLLPKHFSFNVIGGRCEKCEGAGVLTIPMHFMPDAHVTCPTCKGKRFQKHILSITYNGHTISDILDLSVDAALKVFVNEKQIYDKLKFLSKVGLDYIKLGQSTSTLSGGEAQRIKLAKELGSSFSGNTLYLLDEPTTGLHPHDTVKLAKVLDELVSAGNTVIVVEHNLDIIGMADFVIDFGFEGGDAGGYIVAKGTPDDIISCIESFTGKCLLNLKKQI